VLTHRKHTHRCAPSEVFSSSYERNLVAGQPPGECPCHPKIVKGAAPVTGILGMVEMPLNSEKSPWICASSVMEGWSKGMLGFLVTLKV
jgi:hypothetical protein